MTLLCAAKSGDIKSVIDFYEQGISLDICDELQNTPLHYAAKHGHYTVAEFLIDKKCALNVANFDGNTPLWVAESNENSHVADLLIESGAVISLHFACRAGMLSEVTTLVANGKCEINAKNSDGDTPLSLAAKGLHKEIVEFLIQSGADVNCSINVDPKYYALDDMWTILHFACQLQWLDIVKTIVKRNPHVDIDIQTGLGDTALAIAAACGYHDMVEFLIKSGANVNCYAYFNPFRFDLGAPTGMNLLHLACTNGWPDVVRKCIQESCDVNALSSLDKTPLHLACERIEIVKLLLEAGADCNMKDFLNDTALDGLVSIHCLLCSKSDCRCPNIIRLLMNHGCIFEYKCYSMICDTEDLKKSVLGDVDICTQAFINKYNNVDLPSIYHIPSSVMLPSMKNLKINASQSAAGEIEEFVVNEIKTNGFCNVLEKCPPVLQMLSVKAFRDYYK